MKHKLFLLIGILLVVSLVRADLASDLEALGEPINWSEVDYSYNEATLEKERAKEFLPTSNEHGEIKYGFNYDDVPIGNELRQRTSYLGVRNVPYKGEIYRIEKVPSLKEIASPVFDESDSLISSQLDFEIIDYNLTSETIRINSKVGEIKTSIPYKIEYNNVISNWDFEKKEYIKTNNIYFVEKEIIDLSSKDNIYIINVDNIFDGVFHLGENSITHHYNYSLNGTINTAKATESVGNLFPSYPNVTSGFVNYTNTQYSNILVDDGTKNEWYGDSGDSVQIVYTFAIDENISNINNITVLWNGYDTQTYSAQSYLGIWDKNKTTGDDKWQIINQTNVNPGSDQNYGTTFSGRFDDFIGYYSDDDLYLVYLGGFHLAASCPYIYSWNGTDWFFDSETFLWANTKQWEGNTNARLESLQPFETKDNLNIYKIKINEELNEDVYFDKINLIAIDHPKNTEVYTDTSTNYYTIKKLEEPVSCLDEYGKSCFDIIKEKDKIIWNMEPDDRKNYDEDLNEDGLADSTNRSDYFSSIIVEFERKGDYAKILHTTKKKGEESDKFAEETIGIVGYNNLEYLYIIRGQEWINYAMEIFLHMYLWNGTDWEDLHFASEAWASEKASTMIVPVNLSGISTPTVKIKYESMMAMGGPDYVGIDWSKDEPIEKTVLNVTSSNFFINGEEYDVTNKFLYDDEDYVEFSQGDYGYVSFEGIKKTNKERTFFIEDNGYYEALEYILAPNKLNITLTEERKEMIGKIMNNMSFSMRFLGPKIFKEGGTVYEDFVEVVINYNSSEYETNITNASFNDTEISSNEKTKLNVSVTSTGTLDTIWVELVYPNSTAINYSLNKITEKGCEAVSEGACGGCSDEENCTNCTDAGCTWSSSILMYARSDDDGTTAYLDNPSTVTFESLPNTSYAVLIGTEQDTSDNIYSATYNNIATTSFDIKTEDDTGQDEYAQYQVFWLAIPEGEYDLGDGNYIKCGKESAGSAWTVSFDDNFPDTNYAILCTPAEDTDSPTCIVDETTKAVGGVNIRTEDDGDAAETVDGVSWCAFSHGEYTIDNVDIKAGTESLTWAPTATAINFDTNYSDTNYIVIMTHGDDDTDDPAFCEVDASPAMSTSGFTAYCLDDGGSGGGSSEKIEWVTMTEGDHNISQSSCSGTLDCSVYSAESTCNNCSQCNWTDVWQESWYTYIFNDTSQTGIYNITSIYANVTSGTKNQTDYNDLYFTVSAGEPENSAPIIIANATSPTPVLSNTNWMFNITATDDNNATLIAYVYFYTNGSSYSATTDYISNNTNTNFGNYSSELFNVGDVLKAEYWVSDGIENTTKYNTTEVTVGCSVDSECSLCMKCSAGTCVNQDDNEDTKDECSASYNACANDYTRQGPDGACDGNGACDTNDALLNVSAGNVCDSGTDTNPTTDINCGTWSDCTADACSANEYWVGYTGDGTDTCVDTDWIDASSTYDVPDNYIISATNKQDTCDTTNSGKSASYDACSNAYTRQGPDGYCDGSGSLDANDALLNVSDGNVCIDGTDANPTSGVNCGTWGDCVDGNTSADEYYIGYLGDGTATCSDTDWQASSTYWNCTAGYTIDTTEHADDCSESDINYPFYSLNSTNSTLAGTDIKHSLKWEDTIGLSGYIFSFNNDSNTITSYKNISNSTTNGIISSKRQICRTENKIHTAWQTNSTYISYGNSIDGDTWNINTSFIHKADEPTIDCYGSTIVVSARASTFMISTDEGDNWSMYNPIVNGSGKWFASSLKGDKIYVTFVSTTGSTHNLDFMVLNISGEIIVPQKTLLTISTTNTFLPLTMTVEGTGGDSDNVYIIYNDFDVSHIYFINSTDSGNSFPATSIPILFKHLYAEPSIAVNGTNLYVTARDYGYDRVYFTNSSDEGITWETEYSPDISYTSHDPSIVINDLGYPTIFFANNKYSNNDLTFWYHNATNWTNLQSSENPIFITSTNIGSWYLSCKEKYDNIKLECIWKENEEFGGIISYGYVIIETLMDTFVNDSWVPMTGTENWSNVTKSINSTVGIDYAWCVHANDTSGNWNSTSCENPFVYTSTSSITDSCTCPASGDWTIQCSDNCDIQACDMQTNNVLINGTGTANSLRNITSATRIRIQGGCVARW